MGSKELDEMRPDLKSVLGQMWRGRADILYL